MVDLKSELKKNPFVLAPMAGITDKPFRSFMREMGCGVIVTELISSYGIDYESERTLDLMSFTEAQRPVGIQLFGEDAEVLARAAQVCEARGADFVDINLGCPVPKVVKKGAGAALLREPIALQKILEQVKKSIQIPLTIKIRTGWDQASINTSEVVQAAYDGGVSWVAIHGRTRAQGYSGVADWEHIARVKAKSPLPIIGNGDISSAPVAVWRLLQSGCDGVMIGRGCLKNPWIFSQARHLLETIQTSATELSLESLRARFAELEMAAKEEERHFNVALVKLQKYVDARGDERYSTLTLKKFVSWFSAGYPESKNFRQQLFALKKSGEIIDLALHYFSKFDIAQQTDTSHEAFLMGGHG